MDTRHARASLDRSSTLESRASQEHAERLIEAFRTHLDGFYLRIIESFPDGERRREVIRREGAFADKVIKAAARVLAEARRRDAKAVLLFDVDGTLVFETSFDEYRRVIRPIAFPLFRFLAWAEPGLDLGILSSRTKESLEDSLVLSPLNYSPDESDLQGIGRLINRDRVFSSRTDDDVANFLEAMGIDEAAEGEFRRKILHAHLGPGSSSEYSDGVMNKALMIEAMNANRDAKIVATYVDDDMDMPERLSVPGAFVREEGLPMDLAVALEAAERKAFFRQHVYENPRVSAETATFLMQYARRFRGPWTDPEPAYVLNMEEADGKLIFVLRDIGRVEIRLSGMKRYLARAMSKAASLKME